MSVQLLDKTRKINKLLHNTSSSKVVFNDICSVLVETLSSNILVISRKGKVLGVGKCEGVAEIEEMIAGEIGSFVDNLLNERFLGVLSTKENVNLRTLGFTGQDVEKYTARKMPRNQENVRLSNPHFPHCHFLNWKRLSIFSMNWTEMKVYLLQAR